MTSLDTAGTARSMDTIYRYQRYIYDLTRKYYLLGRDHLIAELAPPEGGAVLELGCGTGRNLIAAAKRYPTARFYGIDISNQMLQTAQANIEKAGLSSRIFLIEGDASDPKSLEPLDVSTFDRVFYSYTLSMMPIWKEALEVGASVLSANGRIHLVDFGLQEQMPGWFKILLLKWLAAFHVTPRAELESELHLLSQKHGLSVRFDNMYRGYSVYGCLGN